MTGLMEAKSEKVGGWQLIETAPKPTHWLSEQGGSRYLLAKFCQPTDEDGERTGDLEMVWAAVAYLSVRGWMMPTNSIAHTSGYGGFLLRDDATHWMLLSMPMVAESAHA